MITAVHTLVYADDPERTRAFFRDVLGWPHVDAHEGWLIFKVPPAELGVHPAEASGEAAVSHAVSFMCDDIHATVAELRARGVQIEGEPEDQGYGISTTMTLPGGTRVQLYQPRHPTAIDWPSQG